MLQTLRVRFRFRMLLASTVLLVAVMMSIPESHIMVLGCMLFLVFAGTNTLSKNHPMHRVVLTFGIVVLIAKAMGVFGMVSHQIGNFGMAALYAVMFSALIHRLTHQRPVTPEMMYGLVAVYLQIGLMFAILYDGIELFWPGSFAASAGVMPLGPEDFTYFSLITLTTVGYGDIYPIHPLARILVTFEAVTGVLFIGLSMARSLMLISDDSDIELNKD